MSSYRLTKRAEADLMEIFAFGYGRFGEAQADAYAEAMEHIFDLLADNPRMGRPADSIGPGIRRHEYRAHVILYEEAAEGILILALVHGSSIERLKL